MLNEPVALREARTGPALKAPMAGNRHDHLLEEHPHPIRASTTDQARVITAGPEAPVSPVVATSSIESSGTAYTREHDLAAEADRARASGT